VPVEAPATVTAKPNPSYALKRQYSSRTLNLVPHAAWCLLKDRIAMMIEFRKAVSLFYQAKAQEKRAENYGIKFGKRTRSWAHFVPEVIEEERRAERKEQEQISMARIALANSSRTSGLVSSIALATSSRTTALVSTSSSKLVRASSENHLVSRVPPEQAACA